MTNIILCGGSGMRLWLISRTLVYKQFLGLWEKINNINFKGVEFDSFKNEDRLGAVIDMKNINIEQNKNKASYYGIYEQVNDSTNNAVHLISTRNVR